MEQVRPVQGLNWSPEYRACAQPLVAGPLLLGLLQVWPQQRALHCLLVSSHPSRGQRQAQRRPRAGLSPLHLAVLRRMKVQSGEKTAPGGKGKGAVTKTAVTMEAQV